MNPPYAIPDAGRRSAAFREHLHHGILPFWLSRSIDEAYGGFFTCFDNAGERLVSADKYTWSQGRMVWVMAKLSSMGGAPGADPGRCMALAARGADFLMRHCLTEGGGCAFVMERDGTHKPARPGARCDTSVYADCFVVLGLSQYAMLSRDAAALDFALRLFRSVAGRVEGGRYPSDPYPVPEGWRAHGMPMILLNVATELAEALAASGHAQAAAVGGYADACLCDIMDHFAREGSACREFIGIDNAPREDVLLGRYANPGHTVECMGFVMRRALRTGRMDMARRAAAAALGALNLGWDARHGGILLFTDMEGGAPRGSVRGMQGEPMVKKVRKDWDSKLWWTHAEALYATLLAYAVTGEQSMLDAHERVLEYTMGVFPNPDKAVGEWIQIRDRQGRPENKVVALPVKDPFHIARSLLLLVELLLPDSSPVCEHLLQGCFPSLRVARLEHLARRGEG